MTIYLRVWPSGRLSREERKKDGTHQSFWVSLGWLAYLSSFKLSVPISERNYTGALMRLQVIILFSLLLSCLRVKLAFFSERQYGSMVRSLGFMYLMQDQLIIGFLCLIVIYQSLLIFTEVYHHFSIYVTEAGFEWFPNWAASGITRGDVELMETAAHSVPDSPSILFFSRRPPEAMTRAQTELGFNQEERLHGLSTSRESGWGKRAWLISKVANKTLHVPLQYNLSITDGRRY